MVTVAKIVALSHYVRRRDGDALGLPEHRAFMKEMADWLMSIAQEGDEHGFVEMRIDKDVDRNLSTGDTHTDKGDK